MISNYKFHIELSKDGYKILKIEKDSKKVYIGSKYNMKKTIEEALNEDLSDKSVLIIFGIGSGEYLNVVCNKFKDIKIIIYEPNIRIRSYVINNIDKYNFIKYKNVYFLNGQTEEAIYKEFSEIIGIIDINRIEYRWIINYDKIYKEQLLNFSKLVKKFICDAAMLRNTNILFSKRWFDTFISNLVHIIQAIPINMFINKYKDIPAIIVSAGPSLSKNIDDLKSIHDNMIILSGGRTLRSLQDKNIYPNLIGIVDPGEVSYKLVKGYIEKTSIPLLFYEGSNEVVVNNHKGTKVFFSQSDTINYIFEGDIYNLGVGGSVAHVLTAAAKIMGCNPIIFIGQDLAYTDEKYHADIAVNQYLQVKDNDLKEDSTCIYVEDIYGGKVKTNEVLDKFRRDLEKIIQMNKDVTFINATEGGAKIKGTIEMTLKEAIAKYKILDKSINFQTNIKLDRENIKQRCLKKLKGVIQSSKRIINESKKALSIIEELEKYILNDQKKKIHLCLNKLDEVDKVIKGECEELDLLQSIVYPISYNILSVSKPKNNQEVIEKSKYLYKSILTIFEEILQPIEETKVKIENINLINNEVY